MINFCAEVLGTKIQLLDSSAEEDGYEVKNLLKYPKSPENSTPSLFNSSVYPGKYTTFVCTTFQRTPVNLKIQFPCPIDISYIVICPKVGQQVSSAFGIQVQVLRSRYNRKSIAEDSSDQFHNRNVDYPRKIGGDSPQSQVVRNQSATDDTSESDNDFVTYEISREFLNCPDVPELLLFRNQRFVLRRDFARLPQLENVGSNRNRTSQEFSVRHKGTHNSCHNVVSLTITIHRANRIPCLGAVEVWGQPSLSNSRMRVDQILGLWRNCFLDKKIAEVDDSEEPNVKRSRIEEGSSASGSSTSRSNLIDEDKFSIPEEFLDPITFEIMTQPLRLPCGVAIDSQTLETYLKEEAKWGRPKNDPFTSCSFSDTCSPVPDLSLKARIDMFLTQHSNHQLLSKVPRTLGSGTGNNDLQSKFQGLQNGSQNSSGSKIETVTNRILASGSKIGPTCIKCCISSNKHQKSIQYASPCKHFLICRNCLLTIEKNTENVCKFCQSVWRAKDVVREFVR